MNLVPFTSAIYGLLIQEGKKYITILGNVDNKYLNLPDEIEGINIYVMPSEMFIEDEKYADRCFEIEGKVFTDLFEDKDCSLWIQKHLLIRDINGHRVYLSDFSRV